MDVGTAGSRIGAPDPAPDLAHFLHHPEEDAGKAQDKGKGDPQGDLEEEDSIHFWLQRFLPRDMQVSRSFQLSVATPLPPEHDYGNVEYKFKLVGKDVNRKKHLTTQLHFRLSEGGSRMFYQLGWTDSGRAVGVLEEELTETLRTVQELANRLRVRTLLLGVGVCPTGGQLERRARIKQGQLRNTTWKDRRDRRLSRRAATNAGGSKKQQTPAEDAIEQAVQRRHWVATVMVYRPLDGPPESRDDVRICVIGDQGVGKSSLVGVLTTGELDDGDGGARLELLRHRHEVEAGHTSSICRQVLGFQPDGVPTHAIGNREPQHGQTAKQHNTWAETVSRSSKVITFLDLAGHPTYSKTTSFGLTSQCPDYGMLVVSAAAAARPGSDAPGCISETTRQHLALCEILRIPIVVVISKTDLCEKDAEQNSAAAADDDCEDDGNFDFGSDSEQPRNGVPEISREEEEEEESDDLDLDHHLMFDGNQGIGAPAFSSGSTTSFTDPLPAAAGVEGEPSALDIEGVQLALAEVYEALGGSVIVVDSETQLQRVCRTQPIPRVTPADFGLPKRTIADAFLHEASESESEEDGGGGGGSSEGGPTTPVFLVSSVRGGLGLQLLLRWLFRCPPQLDWTPRQSPQSPQLALPSAPGVPDTLLQMAPPHTFLAEFSVSEVFDLDRVGLVLGGLLHQSQLNVGDPVCFGPLPTCVTCEKAQDSPHGALTENGNSSDNSQAPEVPWPSPLRQQGRCRVCCGGLQWFHAARIASMQLHHLPVERILAGQTAAIALDFLGAWVPRALRPDPGACLDGLPEITWDDPFEGDDDSDEAGAFDMDAFISPKSQEALLLNAPVPSQGSVGDFEDSFSAIQIAPGSRRRRALRGGKGLVVMGILDPSSLSKSSPNISSSNQPPNGVAADPKDASRPSSAAVAEETHQPMLPTPGLLAEYIRWRHYPSVCQGFDAQLTVESLPDADYTTADWRPLIYCRSLRRAASLVAIYPSPKLEIGRTFVLRFTFSPNDPEWVSLRSKLVVMDQGRIVRMQGRVVRLWISDGRSSPAAEDSSSSSGELVDTPLSCPPVVVASGYSNGESMNGTSEEPCSATSNPVSPTTTASEEEEENLRFLSIGRPKECVYCNPSSAAHGQLSEASSHPSTVGQMDKTAPLLYQKSVELGADPINLHSGHNPRSGVERINSLDPELPEEAVAVSAAVAEHWCAVGRSVIPYSGDPDLLETYANAHPFSFTVFRRSRSRKRSSFRGKTQSSSAGHS